MYDTSSYARTISEDKHHTTMELSPENLESLSYRQLQKAAKGRGLNAGGKKSDILKRIRNHQSTAKQKENAVPEPKSSTAKSQHQPLSGKENDDQAVARTDRIMTFSEGSLRLQKKKALGQISLNSPRVSQRMTVSGLNNKPFVGPVTAKKAQANNVKSSPAPSSATAKEGDTRNVVAAVSVENHSDKNNAEQEPSINTSAATSVLFMEEQGESHGLEATGEENTAATTVANVIGDEGMGTTSGAPAAEGKEDSEQQQQEHAEGVMVEDEGEEETPSAEEKQGEPAVLAVDAPVLPSQPVDNADDAPVSQADENAAVTEKAGQVIGEVGKAALREWENFGVPQPTGLVVDEEIKGLVEGSKYLRFADGMRSVQCTLTGKKMAPDYFGILNYIGSRRVQQLLVEGPFYMSDYEGMFLVEDPADEGFVFCELTGMRMFKSKAAVDQHVNGQPFKEMMALLRAKLES